MANNTQSSSNAKPKANIALTKLSSDECDTLFASVSSKLNIHKSQFYYPIYNKILNAEETHTPDELRGLVFDSKFKCKEVLAKILTNDYEDIDEDGDCDDANDGANDCEDGEGTTDSIEPSITEIKDIENIISDTESEINLSDVLNNTENFELPTDVDDLESQSDKEYDEVEDAIRNTYTITGIVEKLNKTSGELQSVQEEIFIKKSPLLEPLKVMQDIYVIPDNLQNKDLDDDTVKNTNAKLGSYNNSSHVEALFLYLANKLVEVGKCPTFPYYYGCINGIDPNYYHDITDEYESVSRTRWFRDRVKNDFDLLILEDDNNMDQDLMEQLKNGGQTYKSGVSSNDDGNDDGDDDDDDGVDGDEDGVDGVDCVDCVDCDGVNAGSSGDGVDCVDGVAAGSSGDGVDGVVAGSNGDGAGSSGDGTGNNSQIGGSDVDGDGDIAVSERASSLKFIELLSDADLEITLDDESQPTFTELPIVDNAFEELATHTQDEIQQAEVQQAESHDVDDFIETLSEFDKENVDMSDFEDDNKFKMYYVKCANMPVNLCMMEKMDGTLDSLLDDDYVMSETEWFAVFFQITFGLAIAQKYFNFVHNDLHSSNIMYKESQIKHLYFEVNGQLYKIPLFGRIMKIIDFARGTFKFGDRWIFSDHFKDDGEAFGQYDYPTDGSLKNCEFKPNPSFDLVRLGTTVIERVATEPTVTEFVERLTLNDWGNSVCYDEDSFQLYIDIARTCHNAVPLNVLMQSKEFNRFKITKEKLPKGVYVFKY